MLCPLPLRERATQDVQQTRSGEGSRPDPSPDLQVPPPSSPLPQGERALSRAPFFDASLLLTDHHVEDRSRAILHFLQSGLQRRLELVRRIDPLAVQAE